MSTIQPTTGASALTLSPVPRQTPTPDRGRAYPDWLSTRFSAGSRQTAATDAMDERARPPQRRHAPRQERGASAFAAGMRAAFSMPLAPVLEVRDLSFGPLAVTELRYDADNYG